MNRQIQERDTESHEVDCGSRTKSSPLQDHMRKILSPSDIALLQVIPDNPQSTVGNFPFRRAVVRSQSNDSDNYRKWGLHQSSNTIMDKATLRWAASSDSSLSMGSPMIRRMKRPYRRFDDAIEDEKCQKVNSISACMTRKNDPCSPPPAPSLSSFASFPTREQRSTWPTEQILPQPQRHSPRKTVALQSMMTGSLGQKREWAPNRDKNESDIAAISSIRNLSSHLPSIAADMSILVDQTASGGTRPVQEGPTTQQSLGLQQQLPRDSELFHYGYDRVLVRPERRSSGSSSSSMD